MQPILGGGRDAATDRADLDALRADGYTVEEPLEVDEEPPPRRFGRLSSALYAPAERFFPALSLAPLVRGRVGARKAELVLHVWSPGGLAACSTVEEAPVFAYYGNPDHKPIEARLRHPDLFDLPRATLKERSRLALMRVENFQRKEATVELMRTCRFAGNICAVDARFFGEEGHPESFYVQNMWAEHGEPASPADENRIVGNIGGNLGATGNTFGLVFLGREVLPELDARLGEDYAVDVFGAGEPTSAVRGALDHPRIRMRGWAHDIDREISEAKVFLVTNNCDPHFVVAHTRVLHAWSLGACVVCHRGIATAMPEVVHGENALLGETGAEIAEQVAAALRDDDLRARIADGGRRTFQAEFAPDVVVERILSRVEAAL